MFDGVTLSLSLLSCLAQVVPAAWYLVVVLHVPAHILT